METKTCENCDAVIASTEDVCPKCGTNFADLEDAIVTVDRAQKILEKRRKPAPTPAPVVTPVVPPAPVVPAKKNIFSSLGKAIRKS